MNDVEVRLWNHLRKEQLGCSFRRQHSIGDYIVDFYCPEHGLVVEVDGDTHFQPEAVEYDRRRDDFICSQGLTVLRVTNLDVRENLQGVIDEVLRHISQDTDTATPSSSPLGRGRVGDV